MAQFDLDIIRDYIEDDLEKNGYNDVLDFEYEVEDDSLKLSVCTSVKNFKDVYIFITAYEGGGCSMSVVFDKIDKTPQALKLLNVVNRENAYFKAYIADNGYLVVKHFFIVLDESSYMDSTTEFLARVVDLAENEYMNELYGLTYTDQKVFVVRRQNQWYNTI